MEREFQLSTYTLYIPESDVDTQGSLRKQLTFCDATTGLPVKRRQRNKCRISILIWEVLPFKGSKYTEISISPQRLQAPKKAKNHFLENTGAIRHL